MVVTEWKNLVGELYGLRRFGIKPGLERIQACLEREGRPQDSYKVISVAGTNGKGTVSSMIAAGLQAHGYRVGLYTSPHLIDVRERFRVDGKPLSQEVVEAVLRPLVEVYGRSVGSGEPETPQLTFFELTTLAAAVLFAGQEVDYALFEVGLGGRLDAVNAIDPDLCVVTTIGLDHTEYLGDEIEDIAVEKAGIFRAGVPAVLGIQELDNARLALRGAAEEIEAEVIDIDESALSTEDAEIGTRHRLTARAATAKVLGDCFCITSWGQAMNRWRWPGRFDELPMGVGARYWFLDAAHNPAGVEALAHLLEDRVDAIGAVVWGALKDKAPGATKVLLRHIGAPVWGSVLKSERARSAEDLKRFVPTELWQEAKPTRRALEAARECSDKDVLVFGSVYLVGETFEALGWDPTDLVTYRDD